MSTEAPQEAARSALSPFRYRPFAVIWAATVVADTGSWMYGAAAAWLPCRTESGCPGVAVETQSCDTRSTCRLRISRPSTTPLRCGVHRELAARAARLRIS